MSEPEFRPWVSYEPSLFKFRELGPKATAILEKRHLYFGPIKAMSDRTEVGAEVVVPEDKDAVRRHFEEYLAEIQENRSFELELWRKQMSKYEEDIMAPFRASRRRARVEDFDGRIARTKETLDRLSGMTAAEAKAELVGWYGQIRLGLREAAVCCLAKTPDLPQMWDGYAAAHRGVCFQFKDRIFEKEKIIERVDVTYTTDGRLHPLELGYRKSYTGLFSTKHISYEHENEVRFFLFGDARPMPVRAADIKSVILGSEALDPLPEEKAESARRDNLVSLCEALARLNAPRWQHPIWFELADWSGFGLRTRALSPTGLLRDLRAKP
jgi:hypothetical protein